MDAVYHDGVAQRVGDLNRRGIRGACEVFAVIPVVFSWMVWAGMIP